MQILVPSKCNPFRALCKEDGSTERMILRQRISIQLAFLQETTLIRTHIMKIAKTNFSPVVDVSAFHPVVLDPCLLPALTAAIALTGTQHTPEQGVPLTQ